MITIKYFLTLSKILLRKLQTFFSFRNSFPNPKSQNTICDYKFSFLQKCILGSHKNIPSLSGTLGSPLAELTEELFIWEKWPHFTTLKIMLSQHNLFKMNCQTLSFFTLFNIFIFLRLSYIFTAMYFMVPVT